MKRHQIPMAAVLPLAVTVNGRRVLVYPPDDVTARMCQDLLPQWRAGKCDVHKLFDVVQRVAPSLDRTEIVGDETTCGIPADELAELIGRVLTATVELRMKTTNRLN